MMFRNSSNELNKFFFKIVNSNKNIIKIVNSNKNTIFIIKQFIIKLYYVR